MSQEFAFQKGCGQSRPSLDRVCGGGGGGSTMTARWSEKVRLCVKHLLSMGMRDANTCILLILRLCGDGAGLSSGSPWS